MGPADRLGMSSFIQEGLNRLNPNLMPSSPHSEKTVVGKGGNPLKIRVVEDQRCELWQGVWTVEYEKKWLPKIIS